MSKTRRHILALAFATGTFGLASLAGSTVAPANASTLDPVDDPAYWSQIWDHVGALNPSSAINPEMDFSSYITSWANDGYLATASEAAAAKAAIDAESADVIAMEAAGSIPALESTAGLLAVTLSPEIVFAGAAAVGVSVLIGTGTGSRVVNFVVGSLFGGSGSQTVSNLAMTGNVKWGYQAAGSGYADYVNATLPGGWEGDVEIQNQSTGALSYPSTVLDCGSKNGTCTTSLDDTKYAVVNGLPHLNQLQEQKDFGLTTTCANSSACTLRAFTTNAPVGIVSIGPSTDPHTRANTSGGAQTDPGTASQKAANVRNAIKGNPVLHQQYDCKLNPSAYVCPIIVPPVISNPPVTIGSLPWIPIYLPSVFPGETLETYAERLRSKQWVGAITATDDPMTYPSGSPALQLAPGTVTSVSIGTSTGTVTVPIYDPLTGLEEAWPTNPPKIETSTSPITIQEVPATYVPAGGGGIHMPTISFACQFPFGFICWAQDVTGWFNVAPQAPNFDFTIPDQTVGGNTYHVGSHYDVNLNIMDSYMSTFRSILTVVLWVGGIYWLAVRLLGFNPGGDPGEAIDEGIGFDG